VFICYFHIFTQVTEYKPATVHIPNRYGLFQRPKKIKLTLKRNGIKQVKNKMLNHLKLGVFLLIIPLTLWNCKEDIDEVQQVNSSNSSDFQFQQKPLSEFLENEQLKVKFSKIVTAKNKHSLTGRSLGEGFSIDTLSVLQISKLDNSATSYNFNVNFDNSVDHIKGLLTIEIDNINNTIVAKLTKIKLPIFPDIESPLTLETEILNTTDEELSGLTSRMQIICVETAVWVTCDGGANHNEPDDPSCFADHHAHSEIITECYYIYSGFGSTGGSTGGNTGGIPNNGIPRGGAAGIGMIGGFYNTTGFMEFLTFMGWETSPGEPINTDMQWWINSNNSRATSLLASIYQNNASVLNATELNALIDQMQVVNFNSSNFSNNTYWDLGLYLTNNNYSAQACQFVVEGISFLNNNTTNSVEAKVFMSNLQSEINNNSITAQQATDLLTFFNTNNWIKKLKLAMAAGITHTAELAHDIYNKLTVYVNSHPSMLGVINFGISGLANIVSLATDTNHETAGWVDLFNMWLFELGGDPINFLNNDNIISYLKTQEGVSDARNMALNKIQNNDLSLTDYSWTYGQGEFYDGMINGNIATSFLGSYNTKITISDNGNGTYTLHFLISNTSGWESATRLRIDNDHNNVHDAIIPNKIRGIGIHLGGNFSQTWNWDETH
jgi:hypothetical protein